MNTGAVALHDVISSVDRLRPLSIFLRTISWSFRTVVVVELDAVHWLSTLGTFLVFFQSAFGGRAGKNTTSHSGVNTLHVSLQETYRRENLIADVAGCVLWKVKLIGRGLLS